MVEIRLCDYDEGINAARTYFKTRIDQSHSFIEKHNNAIEGYDYVKSHGYIKNYSVINPNIENYRVVILDDIDAFLIKVSNNKKGIINNNVTLDVYAETHLISSVIKNILLLNIDKVNTLTQINMLKFIYYYYSFYRKQLDNMLSLTQNVVYLLSGTIKVLIDKDNGEFPVISG